MKTITAALIAIACVLGLVAADYGASSYGSGYGHAGGYGYGSVSYVPVSGGSAGGLGQGGLLTLIGLLFLLMFLFRPISSTSSGITIINATSA